MPLARIEATAIKTSVVIGMVTLCLAACGAQGANHSASSGTSQCQGRFTDWLKGDGGADMDALGEAFHGYHDATTALATSLPSAAGLSRLSSAATDLQAVAQAGQVDLPPACMPGFRTAYGAALTDFDRVAQGARDGAQAARNGNWQTAVIDIRAANPRAASRRECHDKGSSILDGPRPERMICKMSCVNTRYD